MDQPVVNLALVDDHQMARDMLARYMAEWARGRVVLQATDGVDYEQRVAGVPPVHIAVVDLRMPRRDGFATLAWIRRHHPYTRCIALSFDPTAHDRARAAAAGALAVVGKGIVPHELYALFEQVLAQGERLRERLLEQVRRERPHLTPRELELLVHLTGPVDPALEQVAAAMQCALNTVRAHRDNLYHKLGVGSRPELIRAAVQYGYIPCPCTELGWPKQEGEVAFRQD